MPLPFLKKIITIFVFILAVFFTPLLFALDNPPKISIIIDDLGYDNAAGHRVANLPGAIVCSILPDVQFSKELAEKCHQQNKEIILHTPMEALTPHKLGPGGLYMHMDKAAFLTTLNADIKAIPYIIGLNNHEGSRLTSAPQQMDWLMQAIKPQGLFYIDSVTSGRSVAEKIAIEEDVPAIHRDVFLDDIPTQAAVRAQLELLLDEADEKGHAIAIGHPYPATIAVLEQELPRLAQAGYMLVPVSALILKKPADTQQLQLPFLRQIWQQITAGNASFYPAAIMQVQLANLANTSYKAKPLINKTHGIDIIPNTPKIQQTKTLQAYKNSSTNLATKQKPLVTANAMDLLHKNFCNAYPNLCYLLPDHKL